MAETSTSFNSCLFLGRHAMKAEWRPGFNLVGGKPVVKLFAVCSRCKVADETGNQLAKPVYEQIAKSPEGLALKAAFENTIPIPIPIPIDARRARPRNA